MAAALRKRALPALKAAVLQNVSIDAIWHSPITANIEIFVGRVKVYSKNSPPPSTLPPLPPAFVTSSFSASPTSYNKPTSPTASPFLATLRPLSNFSLSFLTATTAPKPSQASLVVPKWNSLTIPPPLLSSSSLAPVFSAFPFVTATAVYSDATESISATAPTLLKQRMSPHSCTEQAPNSPLTDSKSAAPTFISSALPSRSQHSAPDSFRTTTSLYSSPRLTSGYLRTEAQTRQHRQAARPRSPRRPFSCRLLFISQDLHTPQHPLAPLLLQQLRIQNRPQFSLCCFQGHQACSH